MRRMKQTLKDYYILINVVTCLKMKIHGWGRPGPDGVRKKKKKDKEYKRLREKIIFIFI